MTTLYVGNLDNRITAEDLKEIFQAYGKVENERIIPADGPNQRIYGFVEIQNEEDCQRAIEKLNGAILYGKRMHVKIAKTKPSKRSQQINKRKIQKQLKKENHQLRNFSMKEGTAIYKKNKENKKNKK